MRKFYALMGTVVVLLLGVMPVLAAQEDPLAHSTLLPGWLGFALVGLAVVLILIFAMLARRGTH